jgi:hypothetical protein
MAKQPRRVGVILSAELERKLVLWAFMRDETLPSWMKSILRLRVVANWEKIKGELEDKAERMGITREDLEVKILTQYGYDFERENEELESEAKTD